MKDSRLLDSISLARWEPQGPQTEQSNRMIAKGMVYTDDGIVLFVRRPTATLRKGRPTSRHASLVGGESIRTYVLTLLRPLARHDCHIRKHPHT